LNGTRLRYGLRGQTYDIDLSMSAYRVTMENASVSSKTPFAISFERDRLDYFHALESTLSLSVRHLRGTRLDLTIQDWTDAPQVARAWTLSGSARSVLVIQEVAGLPPSASFVLIQGKQERKMMSDLAGRVRFQTRLKGNQVAAFELRAN
jgi:hypothetical protein